MRLRAVSWLLFALLLAATTAFRFWPSPPIETDLLTLLPATERNPAAEQAAASLGRLTGERAVFLIGLPQVEDARDAATFLADQLRTGHFFKNCVAKIPSPDPAALLDLYRPYRFGLLAHDVRAIPATRDDFAGRLAARLSGPFGGGALPLADDPFALFDDWLAALPFRQFRLNFEDGWLGVRDAGTSWLLVSAELAGSAFEPTLQRELQAALATAEHQLQQRWPAVQLLRAGAVFHAAAARESAESEMNIIGVGSLLGIVILLLLAYRSLTPLVLGLLSVSIGLCAAALISLAVFGRLHLMTLVFGASLIGEAIDYAIQFFSARLGAGPEWDSRQGLQSILPGLAVALATSVVGYSVLGVTPFPAVRQIAVFAISGLIAAWLSVVLLLPWWLSRPTRQTPGPLLTLPAKWLDFWRARISGRTFLLLAGSLLLLAAPGWLRLAADDDVRALIQPTPALMTQETRLRALTGMEAGSQFFLIEGDDAEQVLQREEALAKRLTAAGITMQGVSRFVPSCLRQRESHAFLKTSLAAQSAALQDAGFRQEALHRWESAVEKTLDCLTPTDWLAAPVSTPFRYLWLGSIAAGQAAVVLPAGFRSVDVLTAAGADLPGVTLVDKPGAVSRLFGEFRRLGGLLLAAATVLVFAVLAWRYGLRGGGAVLLPTLLAQAIALGVLGYAGSPLNLFHVLALVLVLGVGVNYAIFLVEGLRGGPRRQSAALLGVVLSAATTLLSFGLLGLSATPALSGFGITLAIGISIAVTLSPGALVLAARAP
jgi:predicted exporter